MSQLPTLLFLHGVVNGNHDELWRGSLDQALLRIGYSDLSGIRVVAPRYGYALRGDVADVPMPEVTIRPLRGEQEANHRRDFARRRTAMEVLLGRDHEGPGLPGDEIVLPFFVQRRRFVQARNYLVDSRVRASVLRGVLDEVGKPARLVIVGHSLGSVIAADLLHRLPPEVEVVGLVTVGSPLGHATFHNDRLPGLLEVPPSNLGWWANFWSTADPVPMYRGISAAIPWVLDQQIRDLRSPIGAHDAATYLNDQRVAHSIGHGLFGSRSKQIVPFVPESDTVLSLAETMVLMALRFAHLTVAMLDEEPRLRYAEALRQVQSTAVEQLRARSIAEREVVPTQIAHLSVDLSDPESAAPVPRVPTGLYMDESIMPLIAIATANLLQPFEIDVPSETRQSALEQLTLELGFGHRFGTNVFAAIEEAREALRGPTNWLKWTALGVGATAVVIATGGLALAAAPGVAGAAAITTALSAFGPGGMIGGLLTAGTLVSAGGGSIAVGLAAPATTGAAVEAAVATQLAAAILRRKQGLPPDSSVWRNLTDLESEVSKELSHLTSLSDKSAPSLKDLKRKIDAIRRALNHLQALGLDPKEPELDAPLA